MGRGPLMSNAVTDNDAVPVKEQEEAVEPPPSFLNYLMDLRGLSPALSVFINRYNDLEEHLGFVQNAIDSLDNQSNALSSSTLHHLCHTMCGRGLRKYIASHLSDVSKLREEAPSALKHAPDLPKLVLSCIGRFYLQGRNAFARESPMVAARQASLLILEFFLLSGCTHVEQSLKQEAQVAALAWRARLLSEGGVSTATAADARGLLLFVASFGVPSQFRTKDLIQLIQLSSPLEIADALRRSSSLAERIPDVIQQMVKSRNLIAAVDTTFTFGLEDKFPPLTVLTSFLRESKVAWKKERGESQGAPVKLKEANEKYLGALKSVIVCLEEHQIDPKILGGGNINLKVAKLENDISDLDMIIKERAISKRKVEEVESSMMLRPQESKLFRSINGESLQISSRVMQLQGQGTLCNAKRNSLYDAGSSVVLDGYSGPSSGTSEAGMLPSPAIGTGNMIGGVGGFLSGVSSGRGDVAPSKFINGIGHGLRKRDGAIQLTNVSIRSSEFHGDDALSKNFIVHNYEGLPMSSFRGPLGLMPTSEQPFIGQRSASLGMGNQGSGTDLYQFADTVLEGELNYTSSQMGVSGLAGEHLYQSHLQ